LSQLSNLVVKQVDEDRYARATVTSLKGKRVTTPSAGIVLRTPRERDAFVKFKLTYATPHVGFIVAQLHSAGDTTAPLVSGSIARYLEYPKDAIADLTNNSIVMVEPGTEFPYSDPIRKLDRIVRSEYVPNALKTVVRETISMKKTMEKKDRGEYAEWKRATYFGFWNAVYSNATLRTELTIDTLRKEAQAGSDYGVPPVPVVVDSNTLKIAIYLNDISRYLWRGRLRCATYFILDPRSLEDETLIEGLLSYLRNIAPINGESDIVVLKFPNWDLTMPEVRLNQRKGYRYFLNMIEIMKMQNPNRLFVLLEAGHQLYPSMVAGFDVVSTSFTGYDGDSQYGRSAGWGSYYDPRLLVHIAHSKVKDLSKFCLCRACEQVTDLRALTRDFWNFQVCRPHFGLQVNSMAEEIRDMITRRSIQEARVRLEKSELSILKGLIPDAGIV
jgi:hypothetical protein